MTRSVESPFSRLDEGDDAVFYARDRFVSHLDSRALIVLERLVGALLVEERPSVLDLMASWDSHIPPSVRPSRLAGIGLNPRELARNPLLTERHLLDLNRTPALPFEDDSFDAVLNCLSVDYLTRPEEIFRETARVLKPGGLFLVAFSNRYFPSKAVRVWRESSEEERIDYVRGLFASCPDFLEPAAFLARGLPRPARDRYAGLLESSDPVCALYAEKRGGTAGRERPRPESVVFDGPTAEEIRRRAGDAAASLTCPHCGHRLSRWAVPQTPFTEWDAEFLYICFNDACPYFARGWTTMARQGNRTCSYRFLLDPRNGSWMAIPVPSPSALRESIVPDEQPSRP
ncbi:MAG: methyltransferase domain-containing protein [Acidobacteriota bacterium]